MSGLSKRRYDALRAAGWETYQITPLDRLRSLLRRRAAGQATQTGGWPR